MPAKKLFSVMGTVRILMFGTISIYYIKSAKNKFMTEVLIYAEYK